MKLKNKFLGLLSLLKIRDSDTVQAVTDQIQSISGTKTLSDMARSPNSSDYLDEAAMTEVLTHKTMNNYLDDIVAPPLGIVSAPSGSLPSPSGYPFQEDPWWNTIVPGLNRSATKEGVYWIKFRTKYPVAGTLPGPAAYSSWYMYISVPAEDPSIGSYPSYYGLWPYGTRFCNKDGTVGANASPWNEQWTPFAIDYTWETGQGTYCGTLLYIPWSMVPDDHMTSIRP